MRDRYSATPHRHRFGARVCGGLVVSLVVAAVSFVPGRVNAATAVGLGTADSYAVLAGQGVTNTGPSTISGDLGVSPAGPASVTGFPPGTVSGAIHAADAAALQAQSDLTIAYNNAAGQPMTASVAGDLGGLALGPGVYKAASSIGLTGTLTLDAHGDPNAVFIFQIGSTLTTASSSRVLLINGAQPCNVFWQVGSSATLGTATTFVGNILALTSISLTTSATINGRALARNGSVTLDTNTITRPTCQTSTTGGATGGPTTGSAPSNPAASARACASSRASPITEEPLPLITAPSAPDSIRRRAASPISGCRAATGRSRSLNRRGPSSSASPAVAAASRRSGSGPVPAPSSSHQR